MPQLAPMKPHAWGTLANDAQMMFLLYEWFEMDEVKESERVDVMERLGMRLADLHIRSRTGWRWCGFHVETFVGGEIPVRQNIRMVETWEEWFVGNFRQQLDFLEEYEIARADVNGDDDDEFSLGYAVIWKVIPRLLRPLQTGGRNIASSLLHGDVCLRNIAVSRHSGQPIVFGASSFYGHNEYDLRHFRDGRLGTEALEAYQKIVPISEPKADFQDRMALYNVMTLLHEACAHPDDRVCRKKLKDGMIRLVDKYPGGWEEYDEEEREVRELILQDGIFDREYKEKEIRIDKDRGEEKLRKEMEWQERREMKEKKKAGDRRVKEKIKQLKNAEGFESFSDSVNGRNLLGNKW